MYFYIMRILQQYGQTRAAYCLHMRVWPGARIRVLVPIRNIAGTISYFSLKLVLLVIKQVLEF